MREAAAERPEAAVAGDPVWVDGLDAQSVSVRERALQYGDGLFETLSCIDGRPRWLSLHLARLSEGCERLRLPFQAYGTLAAEIRALAAGQDRCVVKVIVSRGASSQRGYGVRAALAPTRIVSRHPWPAARSGALALGTSEVCLGENPALAGLKHLNRLEQVMAQIRRPVDLDEVLML
jgi:4-amino-4-deoxychorismate lyase